MKKRLISIALMVIMVISQAGYAASFTDVPSEHWAYGVISELSDKGIISGMGNGTYEPDGTLTKAQFVKLLTCALGDYDAAKEYRPAFLDTPKGEWYTPYVACGLQNGIIKKDSDFFYPDSPITRGEAAVWIVNAMGIERDAVCTFSDVSDPEQKKAIAISQKRGIINGYEDGTFRPGNTLTRAEAAALISRTMKNAPKFGELREDAANEIVFKENVKYITAEDSNKITKADNSKNTVTFSSPGEAVESLQKGDVVYVEAGKNNTDAVFKVTGVKKSGSDVVVSITAPSISEVLESMDISAIVSPSAEDLEKNGNVSNIRPSTSAGALSGSGAYAPGESYAGALSSVGGLDIDAGAEITPDMHYEDGKIVWEIPASGNAKTDFTLQTKNYKDKKGAYASLDMNMEVLVDVKLSGENFDAELYAKAEVGSEIKAVAGYSASKSASPAIELPSIEVSVAGPIVVEITPSLVATASGEFKVEATATLTNNIGCEFVDGEFETHSQSNLTAELEANANGYLEVGPAIDAVIGLKDFEIFKKKFDAPEILEFTADMGIGISGETQIKQKGSIGTSGAKYEGHQNTPNENGVIHNCAFCVEGEIYSFDKFTFGLADDLNELVKNVYEKGLTYESEKFKFPFSPWYYSVGEWGNECELASCPHKLVRVKGKITEKDTGDLIGGASVNADSVSAYIDFKKENLAQPKSAVSSGAAMYEMFLEPGKWNLTAKEEKHKDTPHSVYVPTDKEIVSDIIMELKDIKVSGYVKDSKTGGAVANAVIIIGDRAATSTANGYYELEIKPLSDYDWGASCSKYQKYTSTLRAQKEDITLNITLEPDNQWQDAYRSLIKKYGKYQLIELVDLTYDDIPELLIGSSPGSGMFSGLELAYTYKDGKAETIRFEEFFQLSFGYDRYKNDYTGEMRIEGDHTVRNGWAEAGGDYGYFALVGNTITYTPVHGWHRTTTQVGNNYPETWTYYDYSGGANGRRISEAEYNSIKNNMHIGWTKDNSFKFAMTQFTKNIKDSAINDFYADYENGVEQQ